MILPYYILDSHKARPTSLKAWKIWFDKANRTVAKTDIGNVHISTVFLGIDYSFGNGPPLLFETMIFGGKYDEYQTRCSTWEEAETMHKKACKKVKRTRVRVSNLIS